MRSRVAIAAMLAAVACAAEVAQAQYRVEPPIGVPDEADLARARELFVAGEALTRQGRWADAVERFVSAYRLSAVPAALYNAATALRALGRHRDARDAFDQLLRDHGSTIDAEVRQEARRRRDEEAARVAVIDLAGVPVETELTVLLDGFTIDAGRVRPITLEVDPGQHGLRVELSAHRPWRWQGLLADGQRLELRVELARQRRPWRSPWLWTAVGLAVAGAAVVTAIVLSRNAQLDPRGGTIPVRL